ncbi:hypothetical protein BJY52DRAFT_400868 [Lactarius psammicola]|nr:hypothetical protein BJY52DRAFT_400868 [Lactarius psammicola]
MVSPTSATSQTPALSYAESAKKAQGAKLASQHTQKPLSVPPRQPPAPVLESKRAGPSSPAVETALTSLVDLSLHDGPPSGANPPVPTSPGESTSHSSTTITIDSASTSVVPSASTKAVPIPNVWNQRIQQRAQTRPQPQPRHPQPLSHMTQSHVLRVPSPTRDPPSTSSGSRQSDVTVSASIRSDQIPASPSGLNGASVASSTSSPSTGTTPSLRREPLPHPPPVDDAESWPEVGKSQTSVGKSLRVSNGHASPVEVKDMEEKDTDGPSPSHPGTPRKSEKTKWIVIPPEELQATADSLNPPRSYAQSRSHSQLGARNNQTRNAAASGSGSMQGSQAPSKTASGRTSTSHSRAHSPSSMASSPQHPGRGRQLPVDIRGTQAPEQQQQQQSSQGNSPRTYADMALPVPVHYGQIARDVYPYGNLPSQSASTQPYIPQQPPAPTQPPPPPPTHYPPVLQLNPTHSQQPYTSSSVSPYPQPYPLHTPSDRYGPAPTQPLPPGWPAPEHYAYPYGYPPYAQPHPILYWPSNLPLDVRQDGRAMYPSYPPVQPPQQIVPPPHVSEDDGASPGGEEHTTHPALPPPTMIARPPPPQESDAVAGYRAVKPILDAGSGWEESTPGRRDMIFGSVGAPGGCKSPSPPPQPRSEAQPATIDNQSVNEKPERAVSTFSIGVSPGETGPSHVRSRARSQPRLSRTENLSDGKSSEPLAAADVKVIDLTSPETKWEFGTANRPQDEYTQDDKSRPELAEPLSHAPSAPSKAALDVSLLFSGPLQEPLLPIAPTEPPLAELHHPYPQPHHHLPYGLPQHIHGPPPPPPQEELQVQTGPGPYPVHQPPPQPPSGSSVDGFEVKDYGYGFGRASGTGHAVMSTREERLVREREWERNRDPEREPYTWRPPRRGSYGGHHERGGYGGRRGRGANGFGRGVSGRGFGRGGFGHQHRHRHQHQHQQPHQHQHQHQQHQHQHQHQQPQPQPHAPQQQPQQQAPPFTGTPPTQAYQPLQPSTPPPRPTPDVGPYLATPIQQSYMPHGFDAYQASVPLSYPPPPNASMASPVSVHPVPRPLSNITYSADPTRFFLLGQLEYYLSAQNMASDLFLRQRMDSRGWIPVSLLASFNRVRQLTLDPQLVRDVLTLSSIVEMRDDCVRMGGGEWMRICAPRRPDKHG